MSAHFLSFKEPACFPSAKRATRSRWGGLPFLLLAWTATAQVPVPVGSGSYASYVPGFDQQTDEYYAPGAQQIIDLYSSLHLDPTLAARPLPSNKWWTDYLTSIQSWSYNATNNPASVVVQNAFGGRLWAFPALVTSGSTGFNLYFPNAWETGKVPDGTFTLGPALAVTANAFTATQSIVTGWSDWGFQFVLPDASGHRMDITLARGVPFVWTEYTGVNPAFNLGTTTVYTTNNQAISLAASNSFAATAFAFDDQGRSFGVFAPDGTVFTVAGSTLTAQFAGTNQYLVFGLLPAHANLNEFSAYAYAKITNTRMDWTYDRPHGLVHSTWTLTATPLRPGQTNTLQGWLPHHYRNTQNQPPFLPYTYLTPRGLMKLAAGNQFNFDFPFHGIAPVLPAPQTNGLAHDYMPGRMQTYVQNFANASHPTGNETYGAGKDLGVTAQYFTFAQQMGLSTQATQLQNALEATLRDWYTYTPGETSHFFARYTNWPALIGFDASYGSQGFNDNHFHYGYFMVATALAGLADTNWLAQYGPMARLVAKEYANWDRSDTNFPFFRCFDIWEGHSWAGGTSAGGGENQESSSEAMNAWVGLFLLGNALQDDTVTAAGAMGYAMESTAVNEYWQDMYHTNFPASYGKSMNGILGGGSLAYATYFDGDPAWVYAIQMVPQNHWNNYLVRQKAHAFYQWTNLWNDRQINLQTYPLWSNTIAYASGTWVQYNSRVWSAVSNLPASLPAPGQSGAPWNLQRDMSSSTPSVLGGYLGNYILGWELLFNPDDVAAQFDASLAINGPLSSDAVHSGITYYLTHTLRGLGDQDANYYTSLPTSQVYYNPATGTRTVLAYNPTAIPQTVTVYSNGAAVNTLNAAPGTLTIHATPSPGTFEPTLTRNLQLGWPTVPGHYYQVQWTPPPGAASTWNSLTAWLPGDGATHAVLDPLGLNGARAYRVLDYPTVITTNLVNGGFETGTGTNAANWTVTGSQIPYRENTNAHSGTWAMLLANTNPATGGISFQQDEAAQGGPAIAPGLDYTLSFWAQQLLTGPGLAQNYSVSWIDAANAVISFTNANFTGGSGYWNQLIITGLIAPANAISARIKFSSTTGATTGSAGAVLIDDVLLTTSAPGATNSLAVTLQPGWQITWSGASHATYGLLRATRLNTATPWTDAGTNYTGTGTPLTVFTPDSTNQFQFFRVYAQP